MKQPHLGLKIAELRLQKGLTQEELVEKCNISVRTIQRIEAGESMPRVYTIKTILAALDRDLDDLQTDDSILESKVKQVLLINLDESQDVQYLIKHLNIGWIAGILSMIAFMIEFADDFYYIAQGSYYFGKLFTVILGICSITFYTLFLRAFILIGNLFKNNFLKIIATIFIVANAIVCIYALIDMDFKLMPPEAYGILFSVVLGIMTLFFGYGVYKLKALGTFASTTGIIHMVLGAMILTVLLAVIAGPLAILTQGLYVILIFKAIELIKKEVAR